jgi:histidyl-tRNA synthetase
MRLIDCKNPGCGGFKENAPLILDYNCDSCAAFFTDFKAGLELLEIPYTVNAKIVRGLDYYTNTVFEFISQSNTVFGAGGRYNGLIEELGGSPTPASGFALGIERLAAVINENGKFPEAEKPDIYIAALGDKAAAFALKLSRDLRRQNRQCLCDIVGRSVKAQMRFADKIGAKYSMVIGDNELETGTALLKDMVSKETKEVKLDGFFL